MSQSAGASRITFDESARSRLNYAEAHGVQAPPAYGDDASTALALPVNRLSESSNGSNDHVYATTTTHTVSTTTTFFRLPRRKKNKGPLFPLPVKIPPPDRSFPPSPGPRPGTDSPTRQPTSRDPPLTAIRQSSRDDDGSLGVSSPMPSPAPGIDAMHFPPPSVQVSPRHSTTSRSGGRTSRSGRTSPVHAAPMRLSKKGRTSTKGSLKGGADEELPAPPQIPSGRTSSSTTGRTSLGGLLNLSRLRHNSEPQHSRPALNHPPMPGTPMSTGSHSFSLHISREPVVIPERQEGDTPAKYLARLEEAVSRGAVATILSKSDDEFSKMVLRSYMRGFAFFGDPIDMSIRKLLMEVELPKETQQIDRVLQSFANRYHECNPGVYASPGKRLYSNPTRSSLTNELVDEAYFIAFSILILHTDVFNKNNKHKMQKHDYTKNAKGQGVTDEILECFYDNISYTPFIHVEDDLNINGERIVAKPKKSLFSRGNSDPMTRVPREPVDPYTLILDNRLDSLRPPLKDTMNLEDPYSYLGTAVSLNLTDLHNTFFKSGVLQIVSSRSRPEAFMSPETMANPAEAHPGVVDIKVTKVGILWRKDTKKKKARSPWQEWGAILTGAQLYFFRNTAWVKSLMHQQEAHHRNGLGGCPVVFKPPLEQFKPDVMMSTEDAVALVDATYKKHKNALVFVRHGGFEEVFLADNENDMNDWLAKLNYASAFKTAGVRMRGLVGGNYEGQKTRGMRRMDSSKSTQTVQTATGEVTIQSGRIDTELAQQIQTARRQIMAQRIVEADDKLEVWRQQLDAQLRSARHLQILAPIQNRTREQVVLAAGGMAAKIKWTRMEMWRTRCHKDILTLDLQEELKATGGDLKKELSQHTVRPPGDAEQGRRESHASDVLAPQISPRSHQVLRPSTQPTSGVSMSMDNIFHINGQGSPPSLYKSKGSWEIPPLTFDPATPPKPLPSAPFKDPEKPALNQHPSRNSVADSQRASSLAELATKLASPISTADDNEQAVLKEAGLILPDSPSSKAKRPETPSETGRDPDHDSIKSPEMSISSESRPKVRRSLQRTLRESHHSGHHRNKKGKDSASSAGVTEDTSSQADSEGLARSTGSFTVHGKKASVITFGGSEWQDISPEERLKLRKSALGEDSKLLVPSAIEDESRSIRSISATEVRPVSAVSASTASMAPESATDDTDDVATSILEDLISEDAPKSQPPRQHSPTEPNSSINHQRGDSALGYGV